MMRPLLRFEHWLIQTFKFDRMSNNLVWLVIAFLPFVLALIAWLLLLHEHPDIEAIMLRDPALSGETLEIAYQHGSFFLKPLEDGLLVNFKPVKKEQLVEIHEDDRLVIGHTIFQANQLDGWTPHLRTIGYYAPDRDLHDGVAVGRSIHTEPLNNWQINEIIVKDNTVEPVHFMIFPEASQHYRIRNVGKKGVSIRDFTPDPKKPKKASSAQTPQWKQIMTEAILPAGELIKAGDSILELVAVESQEALALKIVQGVRPSYLLSRENRNIIGGLRMIPREYIPDYLVDEEFLEYVRQAIEAGLFAPNEQAVRQGKLRLRVNGFDATGKLVSANFARLSSQEKFLLHKVFLFRERPGVMLRWRRPFNRDSEDSYRFDPAQVENFEIETRTLMLKGISDYAARLTNPHTIAEELATDRGEIYDRDRRSHARLIAFETPQEGAAERPAAVAELLLVPIADAKTMLTLNTKNALEQSVYVAGGYRLSGGTTVVYEQGAFQKAQESARSPLQPGETFSDGRYTFRYDAPGKGLLAVNLKDGKSVRRYYPLGERLAHIVGYSYAKSQFKGQIERIFDKILLGREKKKLWWSLDRTVERTPGNNLMLTIDDDLQRVVYAELEQKLHALNTKYGTSQFRGAAIVITKTGEILASATLPSYNPNSLQSVLRALFDSSRDPWNSAFINRATHKSYPPGSTMKVIMSTIALDRKEQFLRDIGGGQYMIKSGSGNFACTGWLGSFQGKTFGKYGIPDFDRDVHGALTLDAALTKSCNNTFAFLALNAGWETIQAYARQYGFNSSFDLLPYDMFRNNVQFVSNINRDLGDALSSLTSWVPTPKTELKLPQLARMGIGQWEIQATPLQMAVVAMTVGNRGLRPYPHVLLGLEDRAKHTIRRFPYPKQEQVFPADVLSELSPMMQHVVQRGSAVRMTRSTIPYYALKDHVAGKTGTAEVEDQSGKKYNVVWFISFAPVENPQMAMAIVIEKGPIISGEAVEVARGIWEKAVLLYPEAFGLEKSRAQ